jgi:hypothetical protein
VAKAWQSKISAESQPMAIKLWQRISNSTVKPRKYRISRQWRNGCRRRGGSAAMTKADLQWLFSNGVTYLASWPYQISKYLQSM